MGCYFENVFLNTGLSADIYCFFFVVKLTALSANRLK